MNAWPGIFVTGTDTGVGKTVLAAALLVAMRQRGLDVVPMKPVQTGCPRDAMETCPASDLEFCLQMAGLNPAPDERAKMCPYQFELAASPHLAARKAQIEISLPHIVDGFGQLRSQHDAVIVEGAGGVLVPLDEHYTMLDLMGVLHLPVVVAARPTLGTLNHTLLTLNELQRARLHIAAVVLMESHPQAWGEIEDENIRVIERLGMVQPVLRFPFMDGLDATAPQKSNFLETAVRVLAPLLSARHESAD